MNINYLLKTILFWIYNLSKQIFLLIKKNICLSTIASLISDISILIAFLLPLKIILLMGSTHTLSSLPFFAKSLSKESFILILSVISILFYLIHLSGQYIVSKNIKQGVDVLSNQKNKPILFNNQNTIYSLVIERITRILSSLIFILLSYILLDIIYPEIFIFLIFYIFIIWIFFYIIYSLNIKYYFKLTKNINNTIKIIGGIGFLLTFVFIIIDHLYFNAKNSLILMIIAFMITKQVTNNYARIIIDIASIYRYKDKIDMLFFNLHPSKITIDDNEIFWNLCKKENRTEWVSNTLRKYIDIEKKDIVNIDWYPLEITNIVAFEVTIESIKKDRYIIKLFNQKRELMSNNEADILLSSTTIPALPLIAITTVENYSCHIFKVEDREMILLSEVNDIEMILREDLLNIELSGDLLDIYRKKHIYIWDKLNKEFINRLKIIANKNNEIYIEYFEDKLPIIENILKKLPLRLVNDFSKSANILYNYSSKPVLLNWGNYAIEPLGAGWPNSKEYIEKLEIIIKNSKLEDTISINDIKLSLFTFELLKMYEKQLYNQTFDNMQSIVNILQKKEYNSKIINHKEH